MELNRTRGRNLRQVATARWDKPSTPPAAQKPEEKCTRIYAHVNSVTKNIGHTEEVLCALQ